MKKQPLYITILIRLAYLILPILALYFLMVFNYDPHENDVGGEHRHTMGPMLGFIIFSGLISAIWLISIIIELIWRNAKPNKKLSYLLIFLGVLVALSMIYFL